MASLPAIVSRFSRCRVLVLGDMVVDEYIVGRPAQISREAPVLILHYTESYIRPGGATNTAYNLCRLGAQTRLVGVIGDDATGQQLMRTLQSAGMNTDGLLVDTGRPTSTKTRIVGKGSQQVQQQIVRIDRVDVTPVGAELRKRMLECVCGSLPDLDALVIADYENGLISQEVIDGCLPEARRHNVAVTIDSHGDLYRFKGVTAATPNQPEAAATVGIDIRTEEELDRAGATLLERMEAESVLITRGREGVALYESDRPPYKLPISTEDEGEVVDPSGAGDTVAAVFTLAAASGATPRQAAFLGNAAGGEVVRRFGTAALTQADLLAAISRTHLSPPT